MAKDNNKLTTNLDENKTYDQLIDEARVKLYEQSKKNRTISNIIMVLALAAFIGSMVMLTSNNSILKIFGWVLVGLALATMIIYYIFGKKKLSNQSTNYVKFYSETINKNNFRASEYSDISYNADEKLQIADLMADGVYKDLVQIASRDVIHGKYNQRSFTMGEVGAYSVNKKKQREVVFVGKYCSYSNNLHFNGHYVFVSKAKDKPVDLPNAISDLIVLEETESFIIYGPDVGNYKDIFPQKFINEIKSIDIKKPLLNLNVVIWAGHSAFYMSYDDEIMVIPFEKPFNKQANEQYVEDLSTVMKALDMLN